MTSRLHQSKNLTFTCIQPKLMLTRLFQRAWKRKGRHVVTVSIGFGAGGLQTFRTR